MLMAINSLDLKLYQISTPITIKQLLLKLSKSEGSFYIVDYSRKLKIRIASTLKKNASAGVEAVLQFFDRFLLSEKESIYASEDFLAKTEYQEGKFETVEIYRQVNLILVEEGVVSYIAFELVNDSVILGLVNDEFEVVKISKILHLDDLDVEISSVEDIKSVFYRLLLGRRRKSRKD